jgi:hypothetical protein
MSGCSDEHSPPIDGPTGSGLVTVTGEVTFIYDNIAADGDVRIDLKLDDGAAERLVFASFWGNDSDERRNLYAAIQDIEIGDLVTASGKRKSRGIEIEELTILSP